MNKKRIVSIITSAATVAATAGYALLPLTAGAQSTNLPVISSTDIGSPNHTVYSVATKGGFAYVARNRVNALSEVPPTSDLQLWDTSNPATPVFISTIAGCVAVVPATFPITTVPTDSACNSIDQMVLGNYLFVKNGGRGSSGGDGGIGGSIMVYDVSNPGSPVFIELIRYPNATTGAGDMDVLLGGDGKYYIVDNSVEQARYHLFTFDPAASLGSQLVLWSTVPKASFLPRGLSFVPGTSYALASGFNFSPAGVHIDTLQVTQGVSPSLSVAATTALPLASGYFPSFGLTSLGAKTYLGVTHGSLADQLLVLDTTNPLLPAIQSSVDIPNTISGRNIFGPIRVAGNNLAFIDAGRALTAIPDGALYAIDTTNPLAPVVSGETVEGQWMDTRTPGGLALDLARSLAVIADGGLISTGPTVPSGQLAIVDLTPVLPTPTPTPSGDYKDILTFSLQTLGAGPSSLEGIESAELRVFNVDASAFTSAYGSTFASWKTQLDSIYNGGVAQVSSCETDSDGACTAFKAAAGNYLVVGRFADDQPGTADDTTVYVSKNELAADFNADKENFADLKIIKKFKDGAFDSYGPAGQVKVVSGLPLASSGGSSLATNLLFLLAGLGLVLAGRRFGKIEV